MLYNTKIKVYNDGTTNITYCSKNIFKDDEQKQIDKEKKAEIEKMWNDINIQIDKEKAEKNKKRCENRSDSMKRATDKVYDIIYQNDFDYFITGTYDPKKIDSTDIKAVQKSLVKWLNNMQQRNNLSYILIPEYHKSGRIHFHALCKGNLTLVDSQHKTFDSKIIYNIANWKYGYSTAINITGDKSRLAHYVTKYVTKDLQKIFGKYFYSSKDLIRETDILLDNQDYKQQELKEYSVFKNLKFKYELQGYKI